MRTINGVEVDNFTYAYIIAALWSSTDEDGEPLDKEHGPEDIAPDTLRRMSQDCTDFYAMEWKGKRVRDWLDSIERPWRRRAADGEEYTSDELDGHDFWFTRNGHGAGFWDRGYGAVGNIVADAARSYGSCDLYTGDDGKVYAM